MPQKPNFNNQAKKEDPITLFYSRKAAEEHGGHETRLPDGRTVIYTAAIRDPSAYKFKDKKIVWEGDFSKCKYIRNFPQQGPMRGQQAPTRK